TATVDELAADSAVEQVMTCSCGGNPSDGAAIITAEVKGIPISALLNRAGTLEGVNTIIFIASDGTEVALPLGYVVGRHAVISYQINDEDLSASVGGNNQL
ncbi:MAG: molybdopterin-dependent oxidoreductase, partial [Raoultibacter sp.]